jgi:hypothetical protein
MRLGRCWGDLPEHPGSARVSLASCCSIQSVRKEPEGWYRRGYLPHFSGESVTQAVTFNLADALPRHQPARWRDELRSLPPEKPDAATGRGKVLEEASETHALPGGDA